MNQYFFYKLIFFPNKKCPALLQVTQFPRMKINAVREICMPSAYTMLPLPNKFPKIAIYIIDYPPYNYMISECT